MKILQNNIIKEVEKELRTGLKGALSKALEGKKVNEDKLPEVELEVPRDKEHGDYASNIAMVMASKFNLSPREVAELILDNFSSNLVEKAEVAGPGFINFKLNNNWLYENLKRIKEMKKEYGKVNYGEGEKVQIEFVSANPTGPLHLGHSRGAVVGDVVGSIMEKAGYDVDREYYINDAGNQMEILGKSTLIRYKQACGEDVDLPENAYVGDYIKDIAREIKNEMGEDLLSWSESKQLDYCQEFAYEKMLENIKDDLNEFGIEFDVWFSERTLHENNEIEESVRVLRDRGYIYDKEGAVWFKSKEFGDDKDRVVIKSDGNPTYLAADIAYHLNKLERGYDTLINVWGADHHGYIDRVRAVIEAFGYPGETLEIIIVQFVSLLRGGEKVPMSKRAGEFVTMRDIIDEVGKDAARYFYIMRSSDSHLDFDLELAKEESSDNPVYYIQYAHARIQSILENIDIEEEAGELTPDLSLLTEEAEIDLMKHLAYFPRTIQMSAERREPHHLANYAYDLANYFHVFYNKCRVINDDRDLSRARLYLVMAARQVLRNSLEIMGISAPDQM